MKLIFCIHPVRQLFLTTLTILFSKSEEQIAYKLFVYNKVNKRFN